MQHSGSHDLTSSPAIAIIGMAGRFPGAHNPQELWHNLINGVKSIQRFSDDELRQAGVDPELLRQPNYVKAGAPVEQVDQFDAGFFGFTPREAEVMDPQQRLFLECSWQALEDAAYDPERTGALVGVFAGAAGSTYLQHNILTNPDLVELVGPLQIEVFNAPDALSSTISYRFNFRGPSVSIQSFCSTSLVAVHFAAQSLLNYECDMALAGGVAISVPHITGYLYQEGGIVSPDGECRSFDQSGQGSVMGNGVGVVILKRLEDALADGDHIYAAIRGSATNNDGTLRAGYTAPGLEGQSAVITEALSNAGIEAESLDYIEAHGTGTGLGDAIELAATIRALRKHTDKTGFVGIGSVKPNIGHLDRASGVTGLIKASLALKNRLLPPSLNFTQSSSDIDLAASPLYINTELRPWETDGKPRRAGVSSFGVGGTNAHVVLEEAPALAPSSPGRSHQPLLLSAKTESALDAMTVNLARFLEANPDANLADVAYTLQVGRSAFNYRRAVVAGSRDEAIQLLGGDPAKLGVTNQVYRDRPVAFLFPGVGDHYVGMARELYQQEPNFRATVDRCCELLQRQSSLNLAAALYPADGSAASAPRAQTDLRALLRRDAPSGGDASALHRTELAQPAVFVIEYALTQLLINWGLKPHAMIGYSLGEYVAACVAGVLSLDDALKLVAARAQLIQQQPAGAMLAVAASEADVQPFLGDGVCLAVANSPTACVLAGPPAAIAEVAERLHAAEIANRPVETTHAFHSTMLAPIAEQVTALARSLTLNAPQIPYISNVTGTWITAEQATDPAYWACHMTETVRFANGVGTLLQQTDLAFVEIGPGQALGSFVRQHPECSRERRASVVHTLRAQHEQQPDVAALMTTLGKLWQLGVTIDWSALYADQTRYRLSLPTYPFERRRFWVEPGGARPVALTPSGKHPEIAQWFYQPVWEPAARPATSATAGRWLVFVDQHGVGAVAVERLTQVGQPVVQVRPGDEFAQIDGLTFQLRPGEAADYQALVTALRSTDLLPSHVLHLWPLEAPEGGDGIDRLAAAQGRGFYSLLFLTQALNSHLMTQALQLTVLTNGMQQVVDGEVPNADYAALSGLCTVIGQEYISVTCRSVDVLLPTDGDYAALAELALNETQAGSGDLLVAYRDGQRLAQRFISSPLESGPSIVRPRGVYLITGGMGGVGLLLAEHLARTVQAKLVLLSRTGLPPRDQWSDWLANHPADNTTSERIRKVQQLEALGGDVLVLPADVTDLAQMQAAIAEALAQFGAINGVLHAAGISDPSSFGAIQRLVREQCEAHFQPKARGLYILEQALGDEPLDFCLLFSSLSAVLGGMGFAGYAAANSFMDVFAQRHNGTHPVKWLSVNWDAWRADESSSGKAGATLVQYEMLPAEGAQAFERVIAARAHTRIVNSTGDLHARIRQWVQLAALRSADDEQPDTAQPVAVRSRLSTSDYEQRLIAIWRYVLGIQEVELHDNFFDLGGNSLNGLQVIAQIKKEFKVQIPAVALFEAPTISALAQYLAPQEAPQVDRQETQLRDRRRKMRETGGSQDIAIISMVGRFPGANTVEQFWSNIRDGVESKTRFTDAELLAAGVDPELIQNPDYVKIRPVLDDVEHFDAAFFGYTPREAELMDPQQRLFHECAWEALELAGYDTQRYKGLIGVFAGTNLNFYMMRMAGDPALLAELNDNILLENDKDALATNVAYKLNLQGPSFAVQTFCSTSLVATHLACRSLLGGECDIALAGGVSVRVPVKAGYLYVEGDQVSPDGCCRTFDASGEGAIFGDGVAIVALKRLEDALADGDTIHAVIKGSAINNDGGRKVGYTAPSVTGQAEVVTTALERSGIDPTTIGYLEAHGTATRLGDPIEVASLTKAYRTFTERTNFCVIGSAKPNVGHLDRASGVTGLIKTAMMVQQGIIPPLLHFERPNPEIDFASSPFVITTKRQEWPRGTTPRRAAVNSLGVGGTNAHVIVEEPPSQAAPSPSRSYQLLLLSARTPAALDSATANLANFLRSNPATELADVAHTLHVGRRGFEQRRMLVVRDAAEAVKLLDGVDSQRVVSRTQKPADRPVAFLFPGVGDHYVGMARDLYEHEPIFQAVVDRCCRLLQPLLNQDLKTLLYPATMPASSNGNGSATLDFRAMLGRGTTTNGSSPLHRTDLAQPTVFVIEYALAQLLIAWGITPQAMLGYSLGEYVAACVAGVLSLDDALRLVATRAQLIQQQPAGAMLAVAASEADVQPFLGDGVCLAVVNSPTACVLAGPPEAIVAVSVRLQEAEIANRLVETTHAFHSTMLTPIAEQVTALARSLKLNAPQIPYISNVTGTWITAEQAQDPAYWARHMTETVRFADGVGELLQRSDLAFVEVGPGQALASFVRQHPECSRERRATVVHTLRAQHEQQNDQAQLLQALGRLWLLDVPIDWSGFYRHEQRRRIPLPTYPFERQRFWVEPRRLTGTAQAATGGRKADVADWFYLPEWIDTPLNAAAAPAKTWLIFADESGFGAQLAERIAQAGHKAIVVSRGAQFAERGPNQFTLRPSSREDYSALLDLLKTRKLFPESIAHLWHAPGATLFTADGAGFAAALESGFYSLIALTKALSRHDLDTPITINVLSTGVQPALGDEQLVAELSPLLAVCKVIAQENLSLKCRTIDVLAPTPDSADEIVLLSRVATELLSQSKDLTVAYRGEQRLTQRFRPERLEPVIGVPARLRQNGVYLITGGLGGIGMYMAEYLARTVQAKLVLIGRSGLPERDTWADWIATHPADDVTSRRMQRIQQLESLGAEVLVCSADVADEDRMRAIVEETVDRFGALHGIIHGAGNVNPDDFHVIEHITTAHCESQFPSKAYGLYILERIVAERAPDFCYLLSSISAVLGGLGYAAYTSANYFMDIFAHRANRHGRTQWLATNWDTWRFVEADTPGVTLGEYEMFAAQGVDAFARVLERGATQIVTSIGDLDTRIRQWVLLESLQEQPGDGASSLATHARPSLDTPYVAPNNDYERRIAAIWQQVLGLEQVGLHDNFFDLGGNSLISLQVIAKLKKEFKTQVPAVAMFEAPTVSALAQYLAPQEAPQVDRQETQLRERRQKMRETGGSRDIAIVGMAGRFPGANTVEQFWQNISNGVESLTFFTDEELIEAGVDPLLVQNPAYVKSRHVLDNVEDFDASFFGYTPREAELMDPQQRLFHECAWEAIEMAGYDTLRYKGLVGVFAGANISLYLMRLATDPSFSVITNESAIFENAQDGLTTNVSYRLNLRGPSFAVQTFCSTSLVATHLACRSLLNGESDMALAGGVSVRVPVKMGHLYREGGQESPDGHCRTFDANAQGAVWADGVAVVLLKRLDDALADGDTIHAVIKGSAINNDGNMKVGYTAPSVVGQSTAIMAALEQSQIDPATIGYLEAHGSATPLGDPIEVASLTKAYRTFTDRTNFCVIGSTKPNVGHLDRASGVAGLIKTTMILKHGQIPPLLHFQRPNPEIDFAGSPFVITTQRREWPRGATPRRAAVNSLGVGGTNAHVVLEEALSQPPSSPSRPYQLLLLSAKTETALDSQSANLANFLRSNPETLLADVAHTLQIGRRGFEQRRMLVVRNAADAVELLDGADAQRVVNRTQKPADRPVAFLFPGVGDHYVGMARDLYEHEPIFQAAVDRCCRLLNTLLEQDLRTLLYPATAPATNGNGSATLDFRAMLGRGNGSSAPSPLHRTDLAQPTVFVIEYALAQLLIAWGIQPKAMIGYSLGEYVAACVAGVLSLDDALRLVATRAQLIQQQPAGAMLAVGASEIAVEPFLGNGVCLAVVNSPTACVLAGPPAAIAAVAERLDAADIANRSVETTHAFHSTMLTPIAEQVTALARSLTLNAPQIPYISNVTGTWITAEQATDPEYWARHMTETVRFANGVGTLLHDEALAFLEVGPGQALGSFVRQHPLCDRERRATVVHTLRARHEQQQDQAQLLQALGRLWLLDVPINWGGFYTHEERRRIPLPTYPFERQRFWAEPKRRPGSATSTPPRRNDVGEWFTTPSWKRSNPGDASLLPELDERHAWLIFLDSCGVGTPLVRQLTSQGQDVITVTPGASFARYSPTGFTVRPREREDYESLLRELNREQKLPDRIVHLWSVTPPDGADETEAGLANLLDHGFYSLFTLAQALGDQGIDRCQISVISNEMQEVTGVEQIVPAKAAVIGPCKVIPQEYRGISCRSIDLQLPPSGPSSQLIDQLLDELSRPVTDDLVAFRGAHRWVQTLEPVPLQSPTRNTRLRENGVYLITGGLGGIGLAMAEHLADACHAKLVLVGRTALPPRAQWPSILASGDTESGIGRRIKIVQELEARTEVLVLQADVADPVQIQIAVDQAVARFGTIHGVLHAAGLPGVGLTQLKSAEAATGVLAPKVHGTLALTQALRGLSLDFLALFSSIASVTSGGPGQIDYCAASAFMEHYAQRHSGEHGATIAVSWGEWLWDAWQEGLQGYPEDVRAFLIANRRAYGIAFHEGTEAFRRVLAGRLPHVYITTQDLVAMVEQIRNGLIDQLLGHGEGEADDRPLYPRPVLSTSFIEPRNELEAKIAAIWGSVLGIADIGINDNFFDLGGNSLVGVEVISKIRRALSIDKLPAYMLYDAPSVGEMAAYVAGQGQTEAVEPEEDLEDRGERRKAQLGILQRRSYVEEVEEEEIV